MIEGIAVHGKTVYVSDTLNHRLQLFNSDGAFLTQWRGFGKQSLDQFSMLPFDWANSFFTSRPPLAIKTMNHSLGERLFGDCFGVAVNSKGEIYIADTGRHRIVKLNKEGKLLTQWGKFGAGPGQFWLPLGIDVDQEGFVYVADSNNHRVQKFTADGIFITEFGDFGPDAGEFNFPIGLAVTSNGNTIYVADTFNHRVQVFTRNSSTGAENL